MHSRQPANFLAPKFRVHSLSYRLDFQICALCFVPVFLQRELFNISRFLFANPASLLSSQHPLLHLYLPSASSIQYIYLLHHIMCFYVGALCFVSVFCDRQLFNTFTDWIFLFAHSAAFLSSWLIITYLSLSSKSMGSLLVYYSYLTKAFRR